MSRLIKAIESTQTGNIRASRALHLKYLEVEQHTMSAPPIHGLAKEYTIEVRLRKRVIVEDRTPIDMVMEDVKRAMVEEIFGEFRPLLVEMRSALYEEDKVRLRNLVAEFENKMFVEGIRDE